MQIDTKIFAPFTLHYEASPAAAASSPVAALCSASAGVHGAAAHDGDGDADDDDAETAQDGDAGDGEQPLVIVSAASSDFFNNSLNLIGR
jgi:hypothetical protein